MIRTRIMGIAVVQRHRALAHNVLVVATTRMEGSWKAYIDAVAGVDFIKEAEGVLQRGTALEEAVARTIFRNYPEFTNLPYAG